jgi:micrococcal nuclease
MYNYKAKVDKIVDGDTIDVVIDLGFKISTHQRIRLEGINTPETYSVKHDSDEYKKGLAAKNFVIQRIGENNYDVIIATNRDTGKYGRYIGTIWLADSETSLNDELVEKGFAEVAHY